MFACTLQRRRVFTPPRWRVQVALGSYWPKKKSSALDFGRVGASLRCWICRPALRNAARALRDLYVGPARAHLIPAFSACREVALRAGALEGGISGSGPSSFWVCLDQPSAHRVAEALSEVMKLHQLTWRCYVTQIATRGAYVEVE